MDELKITVNINNIVVDKDIPNDIDVDDLVNKIKTKMDEKYKDTSTENVINDILDNKINLKKYVVLKILNKINDIVGNEQIDDIDNFVVMRHILEKLDPIKFVEENLDLLSYANITKKDIKYNTATTKKFYQIAFIKHLLNAINKPIKSRRSSIMVKGKKICNNLLHIIVNIQLLLFLLQLTEKKS